MGYGLAGPIAPFGNIDARADERMLIMRDCETIVFWNWSEINVSTKLPAGRVVIGDRASRIFPVSHGWRLSIFVRVVMSLNIAILRIGFWRRGTGWGVFRKMWRVASVVVANMIKLNMRANVLSSF